MSSCCNVSTLTPFCAWVEPRRDVRFCCWSKVTPAPCFLSWTEHEENFHLESVVCFSEPWTRLYEFNVFWSGPLDPVLFSGGHPVCPAGDEASVRERDRAEQNWPGFCWWRFHSHRMRRWSWFCGFWCFCPGVPEAAADTVSAHWVSDVTSVRGSEFIRRSPECGEMWLLFFFWWI